MKRFAISVAVMWLAAGFQQALSPSFALGGVPPNYVLVAMGCLTLCMDRRAGTILGFSAGLLEGAIAGANLGAYVVSRTTTGFLLGWVKSIEFDSSWIVAFFAVAILTLMSQIQFMFIAPPSKIGPFLLATIGSAMYNGVLAMPLFILLKRVLDPPTR